MMQPTRVFAAYFLVLLTSCWSMLKRGDERLKKVELVSGDFLQVAPGVRTLKKIRLQA